MKRNILIIVEALLIIVAPFYKISVRLYFKFSRHILKRYFGIETPIYRKWRKYRANKLQLALDAENNN